MRCDTDKDVITRLFGYPFYRSLTVILCFCFAKSLKQNDRRRDNLSTVCDIPVLTSEPAGCSELFRNFFLIIIILICTTALSVSLYALCFIVSRTFALVAYYLCTTYAMCIVVHCICSYNVHCSCWAFLTANFLLALFLAQSTEFRFFFLCTFFIYII